MALLSGIVLGFMIGFGVMVAFVYFENQRSLKRQRRAVYIAGMSKLSVPDTRRIFPKESVPQWIVFPTWEKVSWLNQELKRIWPFVDKAASALLQSILEPILEQYKPSLISSLTFQKFTLGSVSPQFTGVRILDTSGEEVVLEIALQWEGNPSIILAVKLLTGFSLPVQVKDASFMGKFRIMFKPLVDEMPGFGAVVYSLKELEKLDFRLKVIGGELTAVPGLESLIEGTIKTAVEDSLLWPARNIIPIIPGDYRNLELRVIGILEVKIIQAKELKNKDIIGKSDPFAEVYIRPIANRIKKTKTISNDTDPIWNENFKLEVEDLESQKLTIKVFDDEGLQAAQLIGTAQLDLNKLEPENLEDMWLTLYKESKKGSSGLRGEVHVELIYHNLDTGIITDAAGSTLSASSVPLTELEKVMASNMNGIRNAAFRSLMKEGAIIRGILQVTVIKAENLIASDSNNSSDPYVVLRMKKSDAKKTTKMIPKTLNPEWNQSFDFMVEDGLHEMLLVDVYDHDTFIEKSIGKCALTLTKVLREGEYTTAVSLLGVKNGVIHLNLKWIQPVAPDLQYI